MSKTFTKNAILCGEIDYFCLLCDEALDCKSDVESHILWENHRKSLKSITYFSKFKDDFIIKIKNHYYCEICNSVMPTVMKTNLHIKDEKHIQHKQHPEGRGHHHPTTPVKRNGSSITISKMTLTESEWNGIVDNQCVLCDMELDEIEEHMKSQIHMINLVQSKIEKSTEFFRKISTDLFFCFTCKEAVLLTEMDNHWINQEHINKKKVMETEQYCDIASGSPESFNTQFKNNLRKMFDPTKNTTNPNASAIENKLRDFQKESMNIDFEKSKATCKICKFSPAFTVKDIQDHIKMHKNAEIQFQSECDENKDNNQLSVSPAKVNKVVEKPSETKKKPTKYESKTLKQCAKSITYIKDVDAYWINKKIVVQRNSFKLISDNNGEYNNMKCFLCDKIFPQTQDKQHWQTSLHKERLMQAKVITSLKNEFVREFHSTEFNCSLYHCGFCNELTPSYAAMEAHLKSYDHEECKHAQSVLGGMIKDMDFVADMLLLKIMQEM